MNALGPANPGTSQVSPLPDAGPDSGLHSLALVAA